MRIGWAEGYKQGRKVVAMYGSRGEEGEEVV